MRKFPVLLVSMVLTLPALAGLSNTQIDANPGTAGVTIDGSVTAGEYSSYSYVGAGTGFGGPLGNGTIYFESDATTLYIGFAPAGGAGAVGGNNIVIELDTRAGGFTDATMGDRGDGGRTGASELARETNDAFDPNFLPDFALVMGGFGNVLFELHGPDPAGDPLPDNFSLIFTAPFQGSPLFEYAIPRATLGLGAYDHVDFFVALISDDGYASNESIPAYNPLQANGNPGFGDGQFGGTIGSPGYGNYNRFGVPEPTALALLGLGALALRRR